MSHRIALWLASVIVLAASVLAQGGQTPPPKRGTGILAGRVVDAAGQAVASAVVALRTDTGGPIPSRPITTGRAAPVRTNAEGQFVFTDLPPGSYQVDVSKAGWLPGALGRRRPRGSGTPVVLAEGQLRNDLTITVWRPAVIAGIVSADNGDPMVGVEVRAVQLLHIAGRRQMNVPPRPQIIARQITDDRGAYRFSDLIPGDYVIAVLTSVLSEPPGFAGAIRAANETPRSYYQTMTSSGAAPMVFERATGVVAGGRSLVDSLSGVSGVPATEGAWLAYPITYHPSALTQSAATIVRALSGEPLTSVNIDVRLVSTWQVSGVLSGPEGPAPWHAVHLVPVDTEDSPLVDVGTAVTDADGAFTFYGVPPGQYVARVVRVPWPGPGLDMGVAGGTGAIPYIAIFGRGPGGGPSASSAEPLLYASQSVTVSEQHVRNLALVLSEGPHLKGRVVLQGGGVAPTAEDWRNANISAVAASGREESAVFPNPLTAEGPFTTPGVWPGKYLLRVAPPKGWTLVSAVYQNRDISAMPVEVESNIDNVVVTLTNRSRTVKGTVQLEAGARGDEAVVLMFPVEPEGWVDYGKFGRRVASARVAENSVFSMPAPPDGEYYLVAIPDADATDWQDPATLAKLAVVADKLRVQGDALPSVSLRLRRLQ